MLHIGDTWNESQTLADPVTGRRVRRMTTSGEVNQTFEVSSTGDNSNQCANVQGVANTGNA